MSDLSEKIEDLIGNVPFEKLRTEALDLMRACGKITGGSEDIAPLVATMQLKLRSEPKMVDVIKDVERLVLRQAAKIMLTDIKAWYANRLFTEQMASELESVDLGEAATA